MTAFDLGNVHLIVDRPGATPAPWPAATGPVRPLDPGPWKPSEPTAFPTAVDPALTGRDDNLTPEDLGLDDDLVAHALHALSLFGEHTYREAAQLLSMWARYDQLTTGQVAEVLDYYRPADLKAVA